ncbi:MAG: N-acetylmuramoyl-L-alanine amidase [Bacteroidales bacterium]|jgi:N-acetylmuramoyl-L-alanine amidase|nr:N-acetylmuramoyl-L-alanine amidase [Bacteroidales bacterium]
MTYIVWRRMFFHPSAFVCLLSLFLLQPGIIRAQDDQASVLKKVVIDPGHGGRDPGATGAKSKEKDIVLDISLKVGKMIREQFKDVEVIYTRDRDVFIELDKRGDIANKAHAGLFISIHANASKKKTPYGAETFVMGSSKSSENMEVAKRENEVILIEDDYSTRYEGFDPNSPESYIYFSLLQNSYLNQSLGFAAELQEQFKNSAKRYDRGVKQANFLVLWKTTMPSVLVELGFISNLEEERFMNSAAGKEKLATSIFRAFCSYKAKIENRSSFHPGEHAASIDQPKADSAPASTKPQQAAEQVSDQAQSVASEKIEFCVQIATSSKPMDTGPNNFKKYRGVERIQTSKNFFKYIVGRTADYATVQETAKKVKADFRDAFVVSIVDGKIYPVAEGLKLIHPYSGQ